jgi:hypothetical protein
VQNFFKQLVPPPGHLTWKVVPPFTDPEAEPEAPVPVVDTNKLTPEVPPVVEVAVLPEIAVEVVVVGWMVVPVAFRVRPWQLPACSTSRNQGHAGAGLLQGCWMNKEGGLKNSTRTQLHGLASIIEQHCRALAVTHPPPAADKAGGRPGWRGWRETSYCLGALEVTWKNIWEGAREGEDRQHGIFGYSPQLSLARLQRRSDAGNNR